MYSVKPEVIKTIDTLADQMYGLSPNILMYRACLSIYDKLSSKIPKNSRIAVLCGKGNNAGDGYGLCKLLLQNGFSATCVSVFSCEPNTKEAKEQVKELFENGGQVLCYDDFLPKIQEYDVFIDAVFGVGFNGKIDKDSLVGILFEKCNNLSALRISIDVPSGVDSLYGTVCGICFKAHITCCVGLYKTGLLSYPAREYAGEILLCDIGVPKRLISSEMNDALIPDYEYLKSVIPQRKPNSHKGTYGRLLSLCGSPDMTGSAFLACLGALRAGAGLVNVASDEYTVSILQQKLNEPVFSRIDRNSYDFYELLSLIEKSSAVLCGCGLGNTPFTKKLSEFIIRNSPVPILLDADGINAICSNINVLKEAKSEIVITPHPAEFARLTNMSVQEVQADRLRLAKEFSKEYNCIVVLKGASTIIASPTGHCAINICGNPGLSKGGSGDVLSGICAGLMCQGINVFDACVCSVYLHAKAGDILKQKIGEYGFLPSDIPLEVASLLP